MPDGASEARMLAGHTVAVIVYLLLAANTKFVISGIYVSTTQHVQALVLSLRKFKQVCTLYEIVHDFY